MALVYLTSEIEQVKWFATKYMSQGLFDEDSFEYKFKVNNKAKALEQHSYNEIRQWLKDHCNGDIVIYCDVYYDYLIFDNSADLLLFTLSWNNLADEN